MNYFFSLILLSFTIPGNDDSDLFFVTLPGLCLISITIGVSCYRATLVLSKATPEHARYFIATMFLFLALCEGR